MPITERGLLAQIKPNKIYINKGEVINDIKTQIDRISQGKIKPRAGLIYDIANKFYHAGKISYMLLQEIERDPEGKQTNLI